MPPSDRYLKCRCKNCGGSIEFPREGAGSTVPCPHCNWPTVLTGAAEVRAMVKKNRGIYRVFAVGVTVAIASAAGFYRYWYVPNHNRGAGLPPVVAEQPGGVERTATNPVTPVAAVPAVPPDPWQGLMAGPVSLEKAGDGNLVYAVGRLTNSSDHQRFGVKVELDVFNAGKQRVGTATDYTPSIDPGKTWKFRALVTDRSAAKAKLIAVKEN